MKKFLGAVLVAAMTLSLMACSKEDAEKTATAVANDAQVQEAVQDAVDAATEVVEAVEAVDASAKSEGVMTYEEYAAAAVDTEVTVETYVQATQSWWEDKITAYTQDEDGAYFLYNMACSEEDAAKLVPGTKIKVTGFKSEWAGEVEIVDATFEIEEGSYIAPAQDVTALLGTDDAITKQNVFASFKDMTVVARTDADGNEVPFQYNYDGSGEPGSDLYFDVESNGNTFSFTVESYLCGQDTEVYKAVEALNIGDVLDMEGFLYWYEGVNPHITKVTVK